MNDFMPVPSEQEWTESDRQWFERVRSLESQVAQLEQDRLKLEGELRQAKKDAANVAKQYTEQVDRGISRQAEIAQLQAELRQEREAVKKINSDHYATTSQLEAAILRHAEHRVTCTYEHGTCDCGLDELLATITPKPEEGQPKEDKTV